MQRTRRTKGQLASRMLSTQQTQAATETFKSMYELLSTNNQLKKTAITTLIFPTTFLLSILYVLGNFSL